MNLLDLVYIPLAIITAPWWAGKKRSGWRERFGHVPPMAAPIRPRILLHAVSVGEVAALRPLVPLLTPHADVVISVTTDTGTARARELFSGAATVVRYPLDFSWAVDRFLDSIKPTVVGLVELEVWPNFVRHAQERRIPVGIINGRLSARSFRGYSRIAWFMRRLLRRLDFIAVQDEDYAGRFRALGAAPDHLHITGSMKWDSVKCSAGPIPGALELAAVLGLQLNRPIIVAGSTGPGEEALLHAACPPGVQLVCAPRKPERFDEAAAALPGCVRLTRARQGSPTPPDCTRFLIDTIGDLGKAYSLATVVVVGRSFMGDLFGSDPIEPVALGKPTVIGVHVDDFARIVDVLEQGGALRRVSRDHLKQMLDTLISSAAPRDAMVEAGPKTITGQQGASHRHAELLLAAAARVASA